MFYGEYEHSLDSKGRVIIPSKFREVLADNYVDRFYITRGLDNCIFMFPEAEWKALEGKFRNLSFTKSEARKFNRLYFSGASEVICDKQGRMLVPKYLKDYAEIKRDVVIIGVSNRIEIWDKEKWREFYNAQKDSFEKIAENLMDV